MDSSQLDSKKDNISEILKDPLSHLSLDFGDIIRDEEESKLIEKILKEEYNFFESEFETKHKEEVLGKLGDIIKIWSQNIAIKVKKYPESIAESYVAKLYTFGSYRLNVNTNDADIDAVCIVPNFINREEHFFSDLYEILKNTQKVSEITPVKNAVVPIIKMVFDSINIDISYSQLNLEKIDDSLNFLDNNLLKDMDEKSYKSFNGRRVADIILNSLKTKENQDNFRLTLRCVKLWAKNKGINSNAMGYLGGISWAILVAKICILFPNLKTNRLLENFFHYFESWDWEKIPVKIAAIIEEKNNPKNADQEKNMDPTYKSKMSIITPAFPCMNSSHNVNQSSMCIMKKLLKEGFLTIKEIKKGNKTWSDLFRKYDFFNIYPIFIEVDIVGNEPDEFKLWSGSIESKIRRLSNNFEWPKFMELEDQSISDLFDLHLYPKAYSREDKNFKFCKSYFFGVKLKEGFDKKFGKMEFDFRSAVMKFINYLMEIREEMAKEGSLKDKNMSNIRIYQIKRSELPPSTLQNNKPGQKIEIIQNKINDEKNLKRNNPFNFENLEPKEKKIKIDINGNGNFALITKKVIPTVITVKNLNTKQNDDDDWNELLKD